MRKDDELVRFEDGPFEIPEHYNGYLHLKPNRSVFQIRNYIMVFAVLLAIISIIVALAVSDNNPVVITSLVVTVVMIGLFYLLRNLNRKDKKKIEVGKYDEEKISLYEQNEAGEYDKDKVSEYYWDEINNVTLYIRYYQESFVGTLTIELENETIEREDIMVLPDIFDLVTYNEKFYIYNPVEELRKQRDAARSGHILQDEEVDDVIVEQVESEVSESEENVTDLDE